MLILREVLRWQATEVAELLDTTVASVNSALQRARATLESSGVTRHRPVEPLDDEQNALLARYVDAFERYDLDSLVALLAEDVRQSMPPYELWLVGGEEIRAWMLGPGIACRGFAPGADRGERCAGVRAVPAERPERQLRAVVVARARDRRRRDRRAELLPRHRDAVPALRSARNTRVVATALSPAVTADDIGRDPTGRSGSARSGARVAEPDAVPEPAGGELHPGQGVDRHGVRRDEPAHVAHHEIGAGRPRQGRGRARRAAATSTRSIRPSMRSTVVLGDSPGASNPRSFRGAPDETGVTGRNSSPGSGAQLIRNPVVAPRELLGHPDAGDVGEVAARSGTRR